MSKFYTHQKDMLRYSLSHPHCCYLADVGTGKTRPSIATFYLRKEKGTGLTRFDKRTERDIEKCLVVCPSNIIENWTREIDKMELGLTFSMIVGPKKKRLAALDVEADFYIVNYDYLSRITAELIGMGFDMVIVDEITYVKHHGTNRSRALRLITKDIPYRIGLTGSPITNSPMDAFAEFWVIHDRLFGTNFWQFRNRYFQNKGYYYPDWQPRKDQMDELADKIGDYSIRVKKEDCLDLPPVVFETREIEMPAKMKQDYREMKEQLVLEIGEEGVVATAKVVLTKIIRLAQITSGFIVDEEKVLHELDYNPKLAELIQMLEGELMVDRIAGKPTCKKVIIFARFIHTIENLEAELINYNPSTLYGATSNKQGAIDKFQDDPTCRILITQLATAFGYNATAADTMIYFEHDFSVEHRIQSLGRNNRIGQTADKLTVIDLVVKDSIDGYTLASLEAKEDIANYIYNILDMKQAANGVLVMK